MPNYIDYHDGIETIEPDESETANKIIEVMAEGMKNTREKYGKSVRISHAKAYGILQGEMKVRENLPQELAQGLFAQPATYQLVARLALAPGEYTDDSKISTDRGIALKIFNVPGEKLPPFQDITNQDFVFDTTKQFIVAGPKAFLQSFKPNALLAPKLSDTTKGIVSDISRGTNAVLHAVGMNSEKMGFFGHPKRHPLAEEYYSQTPYRYGTYLAKLGVVPVTPGLKELEHLPFDPQTPEALREATVAFFKTRSAEFDFVVQLCTNLDDMPIEDAHTPWNEEKSPYRPVARITIPAQDAYDPVNAETVENYSFSPAHCLVEHRPLGGVNRARLVVYTTMARMRRQQNQQPDTEPVAPEQPTATT